MSMEPASGTPLYELLYRALRWRLAPHRLQEAPGGQSEVTTKFTVTRRFLVIEHSVFGLFGIGVGVGVGYVYSDSLAVVAATSLGAMALALFLGAMESRLAPDGFSESRCEESPNEGEGAKHPEIHFDVAEPVERRQEEKDETEGSHGQEATGPEDELSPQPSPRCFDSGFKPLEVRVK